MSSRMRFFVCSSYPHFPQNVHIFIVKEKSNKKEKLRKSPTCSLL